MLDDGAPLLDPDEDVEAVLGVLLPIADVPIPKPSYADLVVRLSEYRPKTPKGGAPWGAPPSRVDDRGETRLLQELEDTGSELVGLREHRRAGLRENLFLREVRHFRRHVDV